MAFVFSIVVFFIDHYYAGGGGGVVSNKHCLLSFLQFILHFCIADLFVEIHVCDT